MEEMQAKFSPTPGGAFMERYGKARESGKKASQKKLCFVATNQGYLADFLSELTEDPNCYYVKFSTQAKDGMYLGRCFMTQDEMAGRLWTKFKPHPKLMCTIQDDDFTKEFRG